jgi:hypothetical protein
MVLRQLLRELESSKGPVSLNELSRTLGVEPSALEGMITYLVRKGRLKEVWSVEMRDMCADSDCDTECPGAASCPFVCRRPHSLTVTTPE